MSDNDIGPGGSGDRMITGYSPPQSTADLPRQKSLDAAADFSRTQYMNIFTTPLVIHIWEDGSELNEVLKDSILAHQAKSSGITKSNSGGWHSEVGQLEFCGGAGMRLREHMYALANEATRRFLAEQRREFSPINWTLSAWANVNRSGDFNKVHVHPGSTWSGTYYIDTGEPVDPAGGAPLHLINSCQGRDLTFLPSLRPTNVYVQPVPGLMVVFPSYVPHMVFPHVGSGTRISVAFNLRKEPFP